jgi:hypothetical protein
MDGRDKPDHDTQLALRLRQSRKGAPAQAQITGRTNGRELASQYSALGSASRPRRGSGGAGVQSARAVDSHGKAYY